MQSVKKVASIALSVVMWIIILVAALYAFTTLATREDGSVSDIAGFTPLAVQSDSMAPTFNKGDLIFIKKCDTSKLEVGDIVTFHTIIDNEYALNTHRIVSVEAASDGSPVYHTKGDANPVEDAAPAPAADVVGRVVFVSAGLGVVVSLLTNPLLFFPFIVVPLIVLLVLEIRHMVKTTQEVARAEDEAALRAAVEQIREKRRREQEGQDSAKEQNDGGHSDESAEAAPGALDGSNHSA